jgi:hypothetical protein
MVYLSDPNKWILLRWKNHHNGAVPTYFIIYTHLNSHN